MLSIIYWFHHTILNANKRRVEGYNGKNILAPRYVQRVQKLGIYADYLLVDSWYAKPIFINTVQTNGLMLLQELQIILELAICWKILLKNTLKQKTKTSKFGN